MPIMVGTGAFLNRHKDKSIIVVGDTCRINKRQQESTHLDRSALHIGDTFVVEEIINIWGSGVWLKIKGKEDEWVHFHIVDVIEKGER